MISGCENPFRAVVVMVVVPEGEEEPLAAYRAQVTLGPEDLAFLERILQRIREGKDGGRTPDAF